MADAESGSRVSYLSFLVTICLSRLVSEIACDRETDGRTDGWTDRQTTRTITIAGPHIVAGQPVIQSRLMCVCRPMGKFISRRSYSHKSRVHVRRPNRRDVSLACKCQCWITK